jgi:hypothetical protein
MNNEFDNSRLFNELRLLNLPVDKYLVVASGPLGIRKLREISDIDIKVDDTLWAELLTHFSTYEDNGIVKIKLSENVEAMYDGSFKQQPADAPKMREQLQNVEFIDGLPVENIKILLYFKKLGVRDKDKADVKLIEDWLRESSGA